MQVVYEVHGDIVDAGSRASILCDGPLTLRKIEGMFPFEGEFTFRIKVSSRKFGLPEFDYVWLDLTEKDKEIELEDCICHIRAVCIQPPEEYDGDYCYDDYIEESIQYVPPANERQPAAPARAPLYSTTTSGLYNASETHDIERSAASNASTFSSASGADSNTRGGGGGGTNTTPSSSSSSSSAVKPLAKQLKSLASSTVKNSTAVAASLWGKVMATASHLQQQAAQASSEAAVARQANDMVALLSKDVLTQFNDAVPFHLQLLQRLFEVQFPGEAPPSVLRHCATWKLAGWQKEDPTADLKNSGLLALHSMIYLGETYPEQALQMLRANQANRKNNYPFAIVGVNLTLLLAELFKLRDPK
jgi:hypothetical protein